ncbi:MAG TPA: aromatic amino acid lyase, partial [Candidatus Angelobacter sp.]|nr:aromatic amino acid lyase [Candidatus Angelobacter sp.]
MNALQMNGNDLSLDELRQVVYERRAVELAPAARTKVTAAREVVEKLLRENRVAYAINTGVGKLSDVHIEPAQNRQLQVNLIRSHSAGVGEPLSQEETRAMMLLRANSLAKGFSGV